MKIVGVGAGPGLLTERAKLVIQDARTIFGSKRAIELAKEYIKCETKEITDYRLNSLPEDAVVLSTGDPMLSGLGKFAGKEDEVVPGISSLQIACSRIHLDVENLAVISAHSHEAVIVKDRIIAELRSGKNIFLLPGSSLGINEVAGLLRSHGLQRKISTFERLGYEDERILTGTTEKPPCVKSDLYCIIINN
jgi:cobalt-precorrin-7 (C5)-methyltransferase